MIAYAIIMFLCALLFGVMAALIHRGNIHLIHEYHRANVKDERAYGRAFGKAMAAFPVGMTLSGALALTGESRMLAAVVLLLVSLAVGIGACIGVQKKYNGGMFS